MLDGMVCTANEDLHANLDQHVGGYALGSLPSFNNLFHPYGQVFRFNNVP